MSGRASSTSTSTRRGLILYAVLGAGVDGPTRGAGRGVRALRCGPVLGLVGPARLDDYEGPAAEARARDLRWLAARAGEFRRAVTAAMAAGYTVLPLRLGTVFRSEGATRAALAARAGRLLRELARLAGKDEWSVKAHLARPCTCPRPSSRSPSKSARRGLVYLLERRRRDEETRSARDRLGEELSVARARLRELAIDARSLPLIAGVITGRREEQVLNEALLVPRERARALEDAVAAIGRRVAAVGVAIGASGPLPPWSFVEAFEDERR